MLLKYLPAQAELSLSLPASFSPPFFPVLPTPILKKDKHCVRAKSVHAAAEATGSSNKKHEQTLGKAAFLSFKQLLTSMIFKLLSITFDKLIFKAVVSFMWALLSLAHTTPHKMLGCEIFSSVLFFRQQMKILLIKSLFGGRKKNTHTHTNWLSRER